MNAKKIIVIGSGIAGLFSAILAKRKGHEVTILTYGQGALSVAGGIIDLIGYDAEGALVSNPIEYIKTLPCNHPYSLIGVENIVRACESFKEICSLSGFEYTGSPFSNQMVPTACGTLKPTCLSPLTIDGSLLLKYDRLCVAGFDILKDFFPDMVAENLQRHFKDTKKIEKINVLLHLDTGTSYRDITALDVARMLETRIGFLNVAQQLKQKGGSKTLFIMPPVLGESPSYEILDKLKDYTGSAFIEVSAIPPSVTGYRLDYMLQDYAREIGVEIIEKAQVKGAVTQEGHCISVYTNGVDRDREYKADAFILATGGVFGGGLMACLGAMYEPIFKIQLDVPQNQLEWSSQYLFTGQEQKFATFGITTNEKLQIIDHRGEILIDNVFVAGRSLSGYDFCVEKSGNGVAICSAYHAVEQL